ncbi:MAG TPA: diguanylate cyclase, partial [Bacilli bacterium]|nr:diguanylate cyclase [Bacilli bacterium]
DAKRLQSVLDEIKENIEKFNAKKKYPFSLNASLGQALYVPSEKKTMEQFINYVDDLMYKNKKNNCLTNSK